MTCGCSTSLTSTSLDCTNVRVDSLKVSVSPNINDNFYLNPSTEYLLVGEKSVQASGAHQPFYSLFVDTNGVRINADLPSRVRAFTCSNSKNYVYSPPSDVHENDSALFVDGNATFTGTLNVGSLLLNGQTIVFGTAEGGVCTVDEAACQNIYFKRSSTHNDNIYYDGNVSIGNSEVSANSMYRLNIAKSANASIDSAQICVQNTAAVAPALFRLAVLGSACNSPVVFNSGPNTPIEFHMGRDQDFFDSVYWPASASGEVVPTDLPVYTDTSNAPHLAIDANGNVGVKTHLNPSISFVERSYTKLPSGATYVERTTATRPADLHVDGTLYAKTICFLDARDDTVTTIDELLARVGTALPNDVVSDSIPGRFQNGAWVLEGNLNILGDLLLNGTLIENLASSTFPDSAVLSNLEVLFTGSFSNLQTDYLNGLSIDEIMNRQSTLSLEFGNIECNILADSAEFSNLNVLFTGTFSNLQTDYLNGLSIDEIMNRQSQSVSLTFMDLDSNITACNIYTLGSNAIGYPIGYDPKALLDVNGGILAGSAVLSNVFGNGAALSVIQTSPSQPVAQFFAAGCNEPSWVVAGNGYVGVGTATPSFPLTVEGTARVGTLIASHIQMEGFTSESSSRPFAIQPFHATQSLLEPTSNVTYFMNGIFSIESSNVDVHLNGRKLAHISGSMSDYTVRTDVTETRTDITIDFATELRASDVLDVSIQPMPFQASSDGGGGLFQYFTITNGTVDSDRRLKSDFMRIDGALERVEQLTGYTFRYRNDARRTTGLVAQDVAEVLPEAVFEAADGTLSLAYGNLMGLVVEAIKELRKELADLRAVVGP